MFKFRISIFVICCLLLNGVLPGISASQHIKALNANFQQDSMAICSGNGITWYSESRFIETGLLVEVAPPIITAAGAETETHSSEHLSQHATTCLLSLLVDLPQTDSNPSSLFTEHYPLLNTPVYVSDTEHSVSLLFASRTARAPPYIA